VKMEIRLKLRNRRSILNPSSMSPSACCVRRDKPA
jgi:hypothetical protein